MVEKNSNIPTIGEALIYAKELLCRRNRCYNAGEILLSELLNRSMVQILTELKTPLEQNEWLEFKSLLHRHAEVGEPVQYLLNKANFYGRNFYVNENVLIPRQETNELIERAKIFIKQIFPNCGKGEGLVIADIGTGSGIIGITMQLLYPKATVYAIDISEEALEVAKINAQNLEATGVNFLLGNLLSPLMERNIKADIFLANLPYIPLGDKQYMRDTVLNYEPELALFSGEDGLCAYRKLFGQLPQVFGTKGVIGLEIGLGQESNILEILKISFPNINLIPFRDISGRERMIFMTF